MFKDLLTRIFSPFKKGLFQDFIFEPIALPLSNNNSSKISYTEDGEPLLFIDGLLSDKELDAIYGDAFSNPNNTVK